MDLGIKGKRALVTGASGGLGRAVAKALAAEGARIIAASRRLDVLKGLCAELGEGHLPLAADLSWPRPAPPRSSCTTSAVRSK